MFPSYRKRRKSPTHARMHTCMYAWTQTQTGEHCVKILTSIGVTDWEHVNFLTNELVCEITNEQKCVTITVIVLVVCKVYTIQSI